MKTAVLISGQLRTFSACLANLNWTVFRRLENPTFFISCADDAQAADAYLLESMQERVHIERVTQPTLPEPPFALCRHAPYAPTPNNASVIQPILRQLWHYKRVWQFMLEKSDADFDVFVRCRPDLFFQRFDSPIKATPADVPAGSYWESFRVRADYIGPWKATCGGVNDRFGVMTANGAAAYFNALDALHELLKAGCPLHPESIQQAALERAGCTISNTLNAEFTCMRLPGHGDHVPLIEYPGEFARYVAALNR